MKAFSRLLFAISVLVLPGCIGAGVVRFNDRDYSAFRIGRKGQVAEDPAGRTPSVGEILARWGEPNSKRSSGDGGEIWHYRAEASEVDFRIVNGRAVGAKVMKTGMAGGYYGMGPGDSGIGYRSFQ
ncbi:hypothetical protein [Luteolibacter sp. LG18]|uniref:hypothetical protein n=1 Tax=Luteolibacter sp. LG18 TaxID=2819286 RepID=UPI002B29E4E4|nr:hypothetical protein llg_38160 [Luteolibacter sp. LG18]